VIGHIKKLYILYWPVFILAMCIGMLTQVSSPLNVYKSLGEWIKDFFGVAYIIDGKTPFNSEWWYISFALTLYLVFPGLYLLMKKIPKIILVFAFLLGIRPNSSIMIFMEWRRYLFVCCLGIYLAENDLMNRLLVIKSRKYRIVTSMLMCLILGGIRCIHPFTLDGFLSISIIVLSVSIFESSKYISEILISLGTYSGTMFLLHGLLYRNFLRNFIYGFKYPIFIYFVLVVLSYSISVLIEKTKGKLVFTIKK
jgi:peptidoglycan/LPS O-acetylase OafA/YrhL